MMKYILTGLAVVLFLGCSSTVPPKSEFRLNPDLKKQELLESGCSDKSLKVAQAFSSSILMSKNMNYGLGDSKQYIYSESQWSLTPNRAITSEFLKLIRESKLFKSVQVSKSRSRNDFILEVNIEDFMQYFNEESSLSYANMIVSLTLINTKTNNVFATQTFSAKVDVETLDANGGVDGLNNVLSDVLLQTNAWLSKVCK